MNYLAHLYLADDLPESRIGNLLGDFAKGVDLGQYPEAVRLGVERHFQVDAFTDAHPIVLQSKRRLRPPYRRYAPVLIDVFYDHFLAVHWSRYSPVPLPEFTAAVYPVLIEWGPRLPERMALATRKMAEEDWLGSYAEIEGIGSVLQRMSRRLQRENPLATAVEELLAAYAELEADFHEFFPLLITAARYWP